MSHQDLLEDDLLSDDDDDAKLVDEEADAVAKVRQLF